MEAPDNTFNLNLEAQVQEVTIDSYTDHQTSLEEHVEHSRHESYELGRQREAAVSEKRLQEAKVAQQQQIDSVLQSMTDAVPQMLKEIESAVKDLALSIAQKFVATTPVTEERIQHLVTDALQSIQDSQKIEVTLHPDDLELLNDSSRLFSELNRTSGDVQFTSSPTLTRGGCRVETEFGQMDATVEAKTNQIKHLLSDPSIAA